MGAACGCSSKKASIIKRPQNMDFSLEEDDNGDQQPDARLVVPPDNEQAHIGIYFQFDELAIAIMRNSGGTSFLQAKQKVIKSGRLNKWLRMVTYGLEPELQSRVVIKRNKTPLEPITFSKYAKIGLMNF